MAINYTQEDTNAACADNAFCSGLADGIGSRKQCEDGGTVGSTEDVFTTIKGGAINAYLFLQCEIVADVDWNAGDWTVRWNVTDGNMDVDLEEIHICRVNSSCVSQASIGSDIAIAENLASTGIRTRTIAGSVQTPSVGDDVVIVFGLQNNNSMFNRDIGWTPDQNVDSPFTAVGGAANPKGPLGHPLHGPLGGPI